MLAIKLACGRSGPPFEPRISQCIKLYNYIIRITYIIGAVITTAKVLLFCGVGLWNRLTVRCWGHERICSLSAMLLHLCSPAFRGDMHVVKPQKWIGPYQTPALPRAELFSRRCPGRVDSIVAESWKCRPVHLVGFRVLGTPPLMRSPDGCREIGPARGHTNNINAQWTGTTDFAELSAAMADELDPDMEYVLLNKRLGEV